MSTTVNMHEAKTHLSRLVEKAVQGESVVIAKAGKPVARIVPVGATAQAKQRRIGFLASQVTVPDAKTFNELGNEEIAALFGADE